MKQSKSQSEQKTTSIWMHTAPLSPTSLVLDQDQTTDVCIIGAGIAGLTTAYLLSQEGKKVIVLDAYGIGSGQTQLTTAHLTHALDDRFYILEKYHGEEGIRLGAESHTAAIDQIENIAAKEKINCELTRLNGYLFLPPGESVEILHKEMEAATRAGIKGLKIVPTSPITTFDTGPCLLFPKQAQFHPLKYLYALASCIQRNGGKIYTNTSVKDVKGGSLAHVITHDEKVVQAKAVVVATNSPINNIVAIHTKQTAYRSYVIGAKIPKNTVPKALYWDTLDCYHYIRLESLPTDQGGNTHALLIIGGEDHKTGQENDPNQRHENLIAWSIKRFPMIESILYRWSGQVMEPVDGMAFIGENPLDKKNVYVATGDSGQGMTHGTIAGMLITDLIQGRENPWSKLYDPSRITLRALPRFAQENLNVVKEYGDWITPGDVHAADEIAPGSGAIIREGLKKIAAYRDPSGELHQLSAVCKHLGGVVAWNALEKTWDCPCHGSRFNAEGKVINGPAHSDLSPLEEEHDQKNLRHKKMHLHMDL